MSNLIPNENTWVGFLAGDGTDEFGIPVANGVVGAVTAADIAAAVDLTDYLISLNASASGNTVPTPRLRTLFETSIPGTSSATFTADFYRDDDNDLAWDTLPRGRKGSFLVSRFGGTGANKRPIATESVEVWPVQISSRAGGALQSGTAQMFTSTCAVPVEPDEDVVVGA